MNFNHGQVDKLAKWNAKRLGNNNKNRYKVVYLMCIEQIALKLICSNLSYFSLLIMFTWRPLIVQVKCS